MATFDHIVIGSGSGGSAVAARLTEDPTVTVLLIEAGGSDRRLEVRAPAAFPSQFHSKIDWDYFTEPEPGCAHRRIYEPRGKVLGGCSSMNAMAWVRGCKADYNDWGLDGWGWDDVLPYFRRMEDHFIDDDEHGQGGPIHVSRQEQHEPVSDLFVQAAAKSGIPTNHDVGGPDLYGASITPVTIPATGNAGAQHAAIWTPPASARTSPSSASRSFVLAALRALHLDPDCRPPPQARARTRQNEENGHNGSDLYGGPQHR